MLSKAPKKLLKHSKKHYVALTNQKQTAKIKQLALCVISALGNCTRHRPPLGNGCMFLRNPALSTGYIFPALGVALGTGCNDLFPRFLAVA